MRYDHVTDNMITLVTHDALNNKALIKGKRYYIYTKNNIYINIDKRLY